MDQFRLYIFTNNKVIMPEAFINLPVAGRGQPPVSKPGVGSLIADVAKIGVQEYSNNPEFRRGVNAKASQVMGGWGPRKGSSNNRSGGKPPRNGSGGSSADRSYDFPQGGGVSGLISSPDPASVKLNSGITPNCYADDFMVPVEAKCACMHINTVAIDIPNTATDKLYDYIINVAIPRLQTASQEAVSFNLNVNTDFSASNLNDYFTALVNAHQIFFYYRSIFTYFHDASNKNAGMLSLKSQITPAMVERLEDLGRKLAYLPMPPNMLELIRYLSGNYLSGDNQGSPLIKFVPHIFSTTTGLVNATDIETAFSLISTSTIARVSSLLGRAVKSWVPRSFKDVPSVPAYDDNFKTIFVNSPMVYYVGSALNCQPYATSDDVSVQYNSFTNKLDGLAYSMFSINRGTVTVPVWSPGLLIPLSNMTLTQNASSRWSYYCSSGVYDWYPSYGSAFLSYSRQDTIIVSQSSTIVQPHLFGATMCQGVNAGTVRNTSKKVLDYLMSIESIKSNEVRRR